MIYKSFVLSGLFTLGFVGVLLASDNAEIVGTDSTELATKAWAALQSSDHENVSELTEQCFKEFGDEAMKQQEPSGEEITNDNASSFPELNSVGTCLFILAKSLAEQGREEKSMATLKKLIDDFPGCRCKSKEGYYWKPAVVAEKRLAEASAKFKLTRGACFRNCLNGFANICVGVPAGNKKSNASGRFSDGRVQNRACVNAHF